MKIYSGTQAAYDAGIVSNDRSWSARLYYFYNNSWSNSLSASMLKSFSLSDYSTDGSNISMGCVFGGKLTVNLIKAPSSSVARLTDGTQIKIRLTLDSANVTLKSKAFVIDSKKLSKRLNGAYDVVITAYDVSYIMTHKYTTSLTEPTCLDIVGEIAAKYGLTVNSSVAEAVAAIDGTTPRKYTPLADFTCKQTLGYMAGCYGCFAYINEDSEICFGWYTDSGNTIARNHVYEGSMYVSEMEERTIAMLESGTQSTPLVAPDSAGGFSINFENPYISQEQLTAIYNAKIADGAVSYRVGKVHYKGNPLNSPGKIITVSDIQSAKARFYIMKRTLRYDGGLSETIECQGESESTINYKITSPTQQKINRALSKMEEAIKAATDAITQTQGSIFEFIPVDENDLSQGNAGYKLHYKDTGTSAFDDCVIMATAGGIGFSTNNGKTFDGLAMYFYEDEAGEIHGCINGEVIRAGSISADKIDTSQLMVSTSNVTGLDDELDSLLANVENANSNASSALEKANSAVNSTSALSVTQQKIIGICLTNDMTYINGAKIATGSICADSIAANAITADKIAAGAITADKLTVGDITNYCKVNSVSYKAYGFETIDGMYSDAAIPTDMDWAWLTPKEYTNTYYLGDWVDFAYNKDSDNKFLYQGQFYNKRGSTYVYFCVSVMLDNGSVYLFNQGTGNGDVYCYGSGVHSFSKTIKMDTSYNGNRVIKIRPAIQFATAPTSTYWFAINDITFRRANAGDITAGKLQSVDGLTYFDLDNSLIETADESGYKTVLSVGGLSSHNSADEVGGLRCAHVSLGAGADYELLYFTDTSTHPLCIAKGYENPDPYMVFNYDSTRGGDGITVYKPLAFMRDVYFAKSFMGVQSTGNIKAIHQSAGYIEMTTDDSNGGTLFFTRDNDTAWGYLYLDDDGNLMWYGNKGRYIITTTKAS